MRRSSPIHISNARSSTMMTSSAVLWKCVGAPAPISFDARIMANASYDYIIVGAGSAGCTLAHRLSEDTNARVLMLEAGGWDKDPWIHIPLGWGRILNNRMHDWMYFAEPEPTMGGRRVE